MPIDPHRLLDFRLPTVEQTYVPRDVILYSLGIGHGRDPLDEDDLDFVYEKRLRVPGTFALTLGFLSIRTLDLGIDYRRVVHSAQTLTLHGELPVQATIACEARISEVWDLGAERGAVLRIERRVVDKGTGKLLATTVMDALCRGDGGFGGQPGPRRTLAPMQSPPDATIVVPTLPQQALLYRLTGDYNALHAEPAVARGAGFGAPILHGLATLGIAASCLRRHALPGTEAILQELQGRFTGAFYPGETLRVELWRSGESIRLRAVAVERDVEVLGQGLARCSPRVPDSQ